MNISPEKFLISAKSSAEARVNEIAAASDSVLSAVEHLTALKLAGFALAAAGVWLVTRPGSAASR